MLVHMHGELTCNTGCFRMFTYWACQQTCQSAKAEAISDVKNCVRTSIAIFALENSFPSQSILENGVSINLHSVVQPGMRKEHVIPARQAQALLHVLHSAQRAREIISCSSIAGRVAGDICNGAGDVIPQTIQCVHCTICLLPCSIRHKPCRLWSHTCTGCCFGG